ncbi:MAG: hypothetical protein R2780_05540 [Crocinitomicaceae bacterium]
MISLKKTYYAFSFALIALLSICPTHASASSGNFKNISTGTFEKVQLATIIFNSPQEIVWVRKNKEFRLQGKMYDVMSMEIKDGKIIFQCFLDIFESKVNHDDQFSTSKTHRNKTTEDNAEIQYVLRSLFNIQKSVCIQLVQIPPIGYSEIDRPPP